MINYKPVTIAKASFAFCRFSIAVLVWISFLLQSKIMLGGVCLVFLLSAILKVKKAPMIRLYDYTIHRFHKREEIMIDQNSIFVAHLIGLLFSVVCLLLVSFVDISGIWYSLLVFALLKSVSAFGFCPASKLYECTINGNCCVKNRKNG